MGLGDSGPHATLIGRQISGPTAGVGTTQALGVVIGTSVFLANSTSGKTGFILPPSAVVFPPAKEIYFFNTGDTTALVYAPTGGATLNGSTSASVSVSANKGASFQLVSGSGGAAPQWVGIVSA
jgi:hypothetical protein